MSATYHLYLAGPITGCTYEECVGWREDFVRSMPKNIICCSPMRGKTSRGSTCREEGDGSMELSKSDHILRRSEAIMARDFFDCNRADVIVFNMFGTKSASIGTCMEAAWGYRNHTPMVFIIEPKGNIHDHAMMRQCMKFRCETVEEAKKMVLAILDVENVGHDFSEFDSLAKKVGKAVT